MNDLFYMARQGRVACEGHGITDDVSSWLIESAIRPIIAVIGPRTVLKVVRARKEAKH